MAHSSSSEEHSRTTTVAFTKEKTLVLRSKTEKLKQDILQNLPKDTLFKIVQGNDEANAKAAMAATISDFRSTMNAQLEQVEADILSNVPLEPVRREGQTEEEFARAMQQHEQDLAEFNAFADSATQLVQSVVEILKQTIDGLTHFSQELWKMIQNKEPNIDHKCKELMSQLAKQIEEGFKTGPNFDKKESS